MSKFKSTSNLKIFVRIGLVVTSLVLVNIAEAALVYKIESLGSITTGGLTTFNGHGLGINNAGQVTGTVYTDCPPTCNFHAAVRGGSSAIDLGTLGGTYSLGNDINDAGQVAGVSGTANDSAAHAFVSNKTTLTDLGTLGGNYSYGLAINNAGQVTGDSNLSDNDTQHAFISNGITISDLGTLGGKNSYGRGINDNGVVTGFSETSDGSTHAFISNGSKMNDLGTLGGTFSEGTAINNIGQVTGAASTSDGANHAFISIGSLLKDLGTLSGGYSAGLGINNAGQVVGVSDGRAFVTDQGTMKDLNTLLEPNSLGLILMHALNINDLGQITAEGIYNDQLQTYLLTPITQPSSVPVPSAFLLFYSALLGLVKFRKSS